MKRTRRSFNSTLPPSRGPTRKTRLKVKGKSRFPKRRSKDFMEWLSHYPCVLLEHPLHENVCWGFAQNAHVRSRGAGGPDEGNVVKLCIPAHREQHRIGIKSFEKKYGLDLKAIAEDLGRRWREQQGETAA